MPTLEIVAVSLILSPLLHPTDMLLVALILFAQFNFSRVHMILTGLFLVCSPRPSGAIFTFCVVTILFLILSLQNSSLSKVTYLILIAPYLCYLLAVRFGIYEVSVRHFLQQTILIIIAVRYLKVNQKELRPV